MPGRPTTDETDIDEHLLGLRARGFTFAADRDEAGMVVKLVGVRVHHDLTDIIELFGADDARAMRIPADEPDIMRPRSVIWRASGPANGVLDVLLHLPDPASDESAGQQLPGVWFPAEPGRKIWLTATP